MLVFKIAPPWLIEPLELKIAPSWSDHILRMLYIVIPPNTCGTDLNPYSDTTKCLTFIREYHLNVRLTGLLLALLF
ncbi:MAG: hypothetical protein KME06_12225 [Kastovskya adunca ATA6-11-RM4]|nr:hypothetical protein [Kastovskya adunca ATA6-11-RM4]